MHLRSRVLETPWPPSENSTLEIEGRRPVRRVCLQGWDKVVYANGNGDCTTPPNDRGWASGILNPGCES